MGRWDRHEEFTWHGFIGAIVVVIIFIFGWVEFKKANPNLFVVTPTVDEYADYIDRVSREQAEWDDMEVSK